MPLARTTLNARSRCTSTKNLGTHESRKKFYLNNFVPKAKLTPNPLFINITQEDNYLVMACYATHLLAGNTLLYKSIKAATAKLYIKAVKNFLLIIINGTPVLSNKISLLPLLLLISKKPNVGNLYPTVENLLLLRWCTSLLPQLQLVTRIVLNVPLLIGVSLVFSQGSEALNGVSQVPTSNFLSQPPWQKH